MTEYVNYNEVFSIAPTPFFENQEIDYESRRSVLEFMGDKRWTNKASYREYDLIVSKWGK